MIPAVTQMGKNEAQSDKFSNQPKVIKSTNAEYTT